MDKKIIVWVGCLLENNKGQYLLLKRSVGSSWAAGKWQLPGGKMEWGEKVMETLHREVIEETGGDISDPSFIGMYTVQMNAKDTAFHALLLVYKGRYLGKGINMSEDHSKYKWVSLGEAVDAELIDGLADFIKSQI